jgi:hypothetical protein
MRLDPLNPGNLANPTNLSNPIYLINLTNPTNLTNPINLINPVNQVLSGCRQDVTDRLDELLARVRLAEDP